MRLFWRLFLKAKGWHTDILYPYPALKKCILIVGPHTSNWDFIIGLAYRSLLGLSHVKFLGKKELFVFPIGLWFRALGGIPVERKQSSHQVDAVASLFAQHDTLVLALSPEGTRRKVEKLRTGFYYIAVKAQVPIVMVGLDYRHRRVRFSKPLVPSDFECDMESIYRFYGTIEGKFPEQGLLR